MSSTALGLQRGPGVSACALAILLFSSVAGPSALAQERQNRSGKELNRGQVEQLRRTKGIRAVAEEVGSYKGAVRIDKDVVAVDLATIADRSDSVIRGTLASQVSSVSTDGQWVHTDYRFRVSESFKGQTRPEELVVVRLPLGRVEFGGGAVAELADIEFEGFKQGSDYVLFLSHERDEHGNPTRYGLAWGTQGAFELRATGPVLPLGSRNAPVAQAYAAKSIGTLVAETKAAVATAAKFRAGQIGKL